MEMPGHLPARCPVTGWKAGYGFCYSGAFLNMKKCGNQYEILAEYG
jgi:hypothetical protein